MFVSRKKYEELRQFCKQIQCDCDKLMYDNKRLRKENIKLKEEIKHGRKN